VLDLDAGEARAELVPVAYDWRAQADSMRAARLPDAFVETIETGWWTTCLEVVPPRERSRGRFHVYRESLADLTQSDGVGWAGSPELPDDGLPVVELFGTAAFPPRLWLYTNFHCNLACEYCVVASSPRARARSLGLERFRRLVDEAIGEGFREIYLTGGEPFLEPDIVAMLEYASDRLPTVVLTNAMLFTGRPSARAIAARRPGWAGDPDFARRRAGLDPRRLAREGLVRSRDGRDRVRPRAGIAAAGRDDRDAGEPR
jgi:hypothetical protein